MISLWSYYDKFDFRETQKKLIDSGSLEKYILFSNNAVESFNHLMIKCLDSNTRVILSKFEEILKYIFIHMNSLTNKNDNNVVRYAEKILISDLLREIISLGYGKNGKIINSKDLKKLKNAYMEDKVFNFTFIKNNESEESKDEN